jgi:hypothetical protein
MRSIFHRSKLHRKFVGQRHGAITVLVREIGSRSDLRNDSLPRVVEGSYLAPTLCLRVKFQHLFGRLEAALTHATHSRLVSVAALADYGSEALCGSPRSSGCRDGCSPNAIMPRASVTSSVAAGVGRVATRFPCTALGRGKLKKVTRIGGRTPPARVLQPRRPTPHPLRDCPSTLRRPERPVSCAHRTCVSSPSRRAL